jgi:response regulator of citrate/malate metabolism
VAEQSDVNRVFGLDGAAGKDGRPLPKGCSIETLKLVEAALKEADGDLSANEVAVQLGTSRVSARRYLEYLNDEGALEVRLKYGVGRPERRYLLKA